MMVKDTHITTTPAAAAAEEEEEEEEGAEEEEEALPWLLNHRDLVSPRPPSSPLSSFISLPRKDDVASGAEPWPIPIINTVDTTTLLYPSSSSSSSFIYSSSSILPNHIINIPPSSSSSSSSSSSPSCLCFQASLASSSLSSSSSSSSSFSSSSSLCGRQQIDGDLAYNAESKLRYLAEHRHFAGLISFTECGPSCSCSQRCIYRVTQRGLSVKVCVVRDTRKGWCVRASQFIPKGSFVFEYAGEFLTTSEAQERQRMYDRLRKTRKNFVPSLLVIREHLPSGNMCIRWNIDATRVGNVARFVNHSCDGGNLQPCLVRLTGSIIPRVVFFARLDILDEEELTFSYGESIDRSDAHPCFCGTSSCKGVLPSEDT